jgi:hypothetical protein
MSGLSGGDYSLFPKEKQLFRRAVDSANEYLHDPFTDLKVN